MAANQISTRMPVDNSSMINCKEEAQHIMNLSALSIATMMVVPLVREFKRRYGKVVSQRKGCFNRLVPLVCHQRRYFRNCGVIK